MPGVLKVPSGNLIRHAGMHTWIIPCTYSVVDLEGGARGIHPPPPPATCRLPDVIASSQSAVTQNGVNLEEDNIK